MRNTVIAILLIFLQSFASGQQFNDLLASFSSMGNEKRQLTLEKYLGEHQVPLIEENSKVFFVYKGEAESVAIAGDATAWKPDMMLQRIEGTDYWYYEATYEPDARLEYKIVLNGNDWLLDPLNPQVIQGGMGPNSELLMPAYEPPLYTQERDVVPWGTYFDTVMVSKYFDEPRQLRIYLPPRYERGTESYPVAFFHDGFMFFDMTDARDIMDNMIYEQIMRPIIAVFVEPGMRDEEFSGRFQKKYARFIFDELMHWIDQGYRTLPSPEFRAQIGISNGGNIALWLLAANPRKNALAAAFSSNVEQSINRSYSMMEFQQQKIFLVLGKYDIPFLVPLVKNLSSLLERKGCNYIFKEYPEGHNWKFWQKHLPEALEYLFPDQGN